MYNGQKASKRGNIQAVKKASKRGGFGGYELLHF